MARNRTGLVAIALFSLVFSVYLLTFSGVYHSSDEVSMLAATDSLARRGQWDVELLRWMGEQQGSFGPDGQLYSRKGIGMTLVALPHYWLALKSARIGNVQAAMLTNGILTALTAVFVYLFSLRLHYRIGVSLGVALAFAFGTMAWPYARYFFSESLAALGLIGSAYYLLRFRDRAGGLSVFLAGLGLGVALLSRLNNAIVAPFLGLLLLTYLHSRDGWKRRAWLKPVILFGLPVLASLLLIAWYNWIRFGSPLTTGYLPEERFATPFLEGVYGLTLSPGKGLFWYNPILFGALLSAPAFYRRHRVESVLVAAVVLGNVAFYAPWYLWWAGHSWGPRFLVTLLPFAALPLTPAFDAVARAATKSRRRRFLVTTLGILVILSVAVQLLGVVVDFNIYLEDVYAELGLYHPNTLFDPARSPLVQQVKYLQAEHLDLAWARDGVLNWPALLLSLFAVLASGLGLWGVWHAKVPYLRADALWALLVLVALISARVLSLYAPSGDMPEASRALARMENSTEVAALTDSLLTEAFQDAYDGHLWVWGVPSKSEIGMEHGATWVVGPGDNDPAQARFQHGAVRLDLYLPPGQSFDAARLPVPLPGNQARLNNEIELVAVQISEESPSSGRTLPVTLYWRGLQQMDIDYTVFVQAVNDNNVKAGQIDRQPCNGGCPTRTWRTGDLVGERYDLPIGEDAPPGSYQIIAGMYDLTTGQNLPWVDAQGNNVGPRLSLGTIDIHP